MSDLPEVSEMDWTGGRGTVPVDCRLTLVVAGTTADALSHQGPVVEAAASHGFEVERIAVKRAMSSAEYHYRYMAPGQTNDEPDQPAKSALELSVRHPGPVPEAATAMQAFASGLSDELELVKVTVGQGGDHDGSDVVVIN